MFKMKNENPLSFDKPIFIKLNLNMSNPSELTLDGIKILS